MKLLMQICDIWYRIKFWGTFSELLRTSMIEYLLANFLKIEEDEINENVEDTQKLRNLFKEIRLEKIFSGAERVRFFLSSFALVLNQTVYSVRLKHDKTVLDKTAAWKMSKYVVFSGPNTGKYGPEKTPYFDTFHAVDI